MNSGLVLERAAEFITMEYAFGARALAASVLVGSVCGAVGVFLVLRRMALLGDAMGHATLPGVVTGFLLTQSKSLPLIYAGALVSALLAALTVARLNRAPRTRPDANVGLTLTGFFGLGVVLLSYAQASPSGAQAGLNSYFFGNAAAISTAQLTALCATAAATWTLMVAGFRALVLTTFDPTFSSSIGFSNRAFEYTFLAVLAAVVVVSIQTVGVVMVAAMLIIPAQAALMMHRTPAAVVAAASLIGALSGGAGAMASYVFEGVSTGPAMVLVSAAIFASYAVARRFR